MRQPGYSMSLLGPFSLTDDQGREMVVVSKKNRLLLAMLALAPNRAISRDVLAGTLWGDHSEEQSRNSLRQALAVLRKELSGREMQMFSSFDTTLVLDPKVVTIDVEQFVQDAMSADAERLREALRLWRGPFLADVVIEDETLDQWLAVQREHFHALHIWALDNLVPLASGHEQIALAQQLITLDTLREASHRRLIEAYQAQGERAQALRHYDKLYKLLKDEMAVEPSAESQLLRASIAATGNGRAGGIGNGPGSPPLQMLSTAHPDLARRSGRRATWVACFVAALCVLALVVWLSFPTSRTRVTEPSIAVLPFEDLSGDPENSRIADGMTVDTITDLSRFWDFTVVARESTSVYKNKAVDARQIGKELNVSHILKGTFQRDGSKVRVTAQLVDTTTGTNIWSERFDRPANEVFAVQSEVADHIANTIGGHNGMVTGSVLTAAKRKRPGDLGAYEIYLVARDKLQNEMSDKGMIDAQKLLDRALKIDPTFSRAHVLYAWTYAWRHTFEGGSASLVQQMLHYARRGVDLDPMDADAHQALGYAFGLNGDLTQAKIQFDQSLQLNPNSFDILTLYACWAHSLGRAKAGSDAAERAIKLNPNFPNWSIACLRLGMFMDGRYADAIKIQSRQPEGQWNTDGFVVTAGSLAALGRDEEAKALVARGVKQFPGLLSIERFALNRGWSSDAVPLITDLMQKAGFPPCASTTELADTPNPVRLPECRAAQPAKPSIAVVPFVNLSGDEINDRITGGVTADIISELTRFRDFDVIARNTSEVYKGKALDIRQIGKELGVTYVLTGTFQRVDGQLRINTQLIDTSIGRQVFAERFDGPAKDLFALQTEVAAKVANSLGGWNGLINQEDLLAAKRKQNVDLDAYALYLLGDDARRQLSRENVLKAVNLLKQAIATDPKLVPAHVSLAWSYARQMLFETDMAPTIKLMTDEANLALNLDPLDARAHAAVGYARGMSGDLQGSEAEYDRALALNPNSFDILLSYSCFAFAFGKGEAGVVAVDRAIRLNPLYPDSGVDCFRYALFMYGRYEDALNAQHRLPEEKWNPDGFAMTAGSLTALGREVEAREVEARGFAKFPSVLSVEKFALNRGWSPPESDKLFNLMRKAGFPLCAKASDFGMDYKPVRLSECAGVPK